MENRTLKNFKNIEVHEVFNIKIVEDSTEYIEVQTGENLLPLITTKIENKTLIVENKNRCNWSRNLEDEIFIIVHYISLDTITLNSYCKFNTLNKMNTDSLIINLNANINDLNANINSSHIECRLNNGTGDVVFSGESDFLYIYSSGSGFFKAQNLLCKSVQVNNRSTGDCIVNTSEKLNVEYTGSGDIYYKGKPSKITFGDLGSGNLIKLN